MIRKAVAADAPAIIEFLYQHAETSMFLLNNLVNHGIGVSTHPHATQFWITRKGKGVTAVYGLAGNRFAVAQAPDATARDWSKWAGMVPPTQLRGMTGVPAQVDAALMALGVADKPFSVNKDTPLYALEHSQLPPWFVTMRTAEPADLGLLEHWFTGFAKDTGLSSSDAQARDEGLSRAKDAIGSEDMMLLVQDGAAVAMAGINSRLPKIVQVGGVYTPPQARGQGLARRAVTGLLRAQQGVERSILFAADASAAKAYEGIGYRRIGAYRVAVLKSAQGVGKPS
jgi:N-acetylglutamate synthase-like GNAT family acetyltransferase